MMEKNKKIIIAVSIIVILLLIIALILLFANKTYTVTFESKGGTEVESQTVKKNSVVIEPENPTREGYIFLGWYVSEESNVKYDFDTKVDKDFTLIAKWLAGEKEITNISIVTEKKEITVDEELSLTAKIMAGDEEVESNELVWTSDDETIATVDQTGKVKALKEGTVTITATVNGVIAEIKLTIKAEEAEEKEEGTTQTSTSTVSTSSNTTTKPSTSTGSTTKPSTSTGSTTTNPSNNAGSSTEPETTEPEVTYTYQWEKIDSSVAGQYMLYIVSSEGEKVAGTATITTITGTQSIEFIPASGAIYAKDVVSSVSDIKVAN